MTAHSFRVGVVVPPPPVKSIFYVMTYKMKPQGVFIFSPVFKEWRFNPKNTAFAPAPLDFVRKAFKLFKVNPKPVVHRSKSELTKLLEPKHLYDPDLFLKV